MMRLLAGRDTLVFSGGGLKALAFCGALEIMDAPARFRHFAGSSAGSIVALAVVLGLSPGDAALALAQAGVSKALAEASLSRALSTGSLLDPEPVMRAVAGLMRQRGFPADGTFKDLEAMTGKRLRVVVATFDGDPKLLVLDAESAPHEQVLRSIRASTAVPFAFPPVRVAGHLCFDAGCVNSLCLFSGGPDPSRVVAMLVGDDAPKTLECRVAGLRPLADCTLERLCVLSRAEMTMTARRTAVIRMPALPDETFHVFRVGEGRPQDVQRMIAQGALGLCAAVLAPELAVLLCAAVRYGLRNGRAAQEDPLGACGQVDERGGRAAALVA